MADLAKLVVRLEAQSSQLLAELDKANKKIGGFERSTTLALGRLDKKFQSIGGGIKSALGVLAGVVSFKAIIDASAEAAHNFALLENAVQQAGAAAGGRTADDFARTSKELQNISTFSDDAIQNVQQLLLRFGNIRTDKFDEATKSVLDLSAALNIDLDSAAKLVGKSLSDPEKGLTALSKAGVAFSESQKQVIKNLVDSGKKAEAQGKILEQLEKSYGGAAEAARNNFGGALKAVQNSLNDLLEVDGGLPAATESMNELAKTLQDPGVKAGADALFSVLITGAAKLAELLGKTAAGLAILSGNGQNEQVNIDKQIEALKRERENVGALAGRAGSQRDAVIKANQDRIDAQIAALEAQYNKLSGLGVEGIGTAKTRPGAAAGPATMLPDVSTIDDSVDKLTKKLQEAGKALTERLQTPLEKYNQAVAEADKLLAANVITQETWARALGDARGELEGFRNQAVESFADSEEMANKFDDALQTITDDMQKLVDETVDADMKDTIGEFEEANKAIEEKTNDFLKRATENTQDILADGIYTGLTEGFDKGAKGILEGFEQMILKLIAQAAAAQLGEALFGGDGVGGSGGGWASAIGKIIGAFGGSMDSGGRGVPGTEYLIGTGAQPERFVPDTAGTFYPNDGGSGMQVSQHFAIQAPQGTVSRATQQQVGAAAARGISSANRRGN